MNQELKQIIIGIIFFGILVSLSWFLFGRNIKPDLSSDFEETEGIYYEGGGNGHPLWNN